MILTKETFKTRLEPPFPFQFFYNAVVHQFLCFGPADLFVTGTEEGDDVAHAVDARKDFSFVKAKHALISLFGIFDSFQAQAFGETSHDL